MIHQITYRVNGENDGIIHRICGILCEILLKIYKKSRVFTRGSPI